MQRLTSSASGRFCPAVMVVTHLSRPPGSVSDFVTDVRPVFHGHSMSPPPMYSFYPAEPARQGRNRTSHQSLCCRNPLTLIVICAYVAKMQTTPIPPAVLRVSVICPTASMRVMEHPARGFRCSVRELPPIRGCPIGTPNHTRTGARQDVPREPTAAGRQCPREPVMAEKSDTTRWRRNISATRLLNLPKSRSTSGVRASQRRIPATTRVAARACQRHGTASQLEGT